MTAPKGNKLAQKGDEPRDAHLQIRVTRAQKGEWVRASRAEGQKLTDWVCDALDEKANAPKGFEIEKKSGMI